MGLTNFIQLDIFGIPLSNDLQLDSLDAYLKKLHWMKCWNCGKRTSKNVNKHCVDCMMDLYLQQKSLDEFKEVLIIDNK